MNVFYACIHNSLTSLVEDGLNKMHLKWIETKKVMKQVQLKG